jgi:hypothetical protein
MKRIYSIIGTVLIAAAANAQGGLRPADQFEISVSNQRGAEALSTSRGSSVDFFCEDFANGLDGNNGVGAWTTGGNNGSVWALATADSPAGFYSSSLNAMASPTASNGWMIFDADFAQGGQITAANPAEVMSGYIQTPVLDMSSLENVKVDFNQYFRYCCAQLSPLSVQVSNDGGATFTEFNATGILITSANQLSANPLNTIIDVSCVAALQSEVVIRWSYNDEFADGYSHYFWGLDDICIYETAVENDLEITQVTNGDILNLWEYKVTPLNQAITEGDGGMVAGVIWRNNGRQDQTNCNIVIEVLDATGTTVLNTTNVPTFDMPAPANEPICPAPVLDTIFVQTGWVPTEIGSYQVRATLTSDQTDDLPDNNVRTRVIEYTTDEYGHNDVALTTGELRGRASADNPDLFVPFGVGNIYTFPNEGSTAYGLTVEFGPNTTGATETAQGANFLAALYSDQSTTTAQVYELVEFGYHMVQPQWVDAGPIYFPFDNSAECIVDEVYLVSVETEEETVEELTVTAEPNSDNDNSTARKDFNSNQVLTWFFRNSYSPSVRLILSERAVGVNETEVSNLSGLQLFPNPAVDNTRIQFNLNEASNVAYEVRDITGKLMMWDNIGKHAAGSNSFNLNVSELPAGNYVIGVVTGGKNITHEKLMIVR